MAGPSKVVAAIALLIASAGNGAPAGRFVDLGGWSLYLDCAGRGRPTVVVENGFDEFATDWVLVQRRVAKHTRICTYDRAGYGFSDPGPLPRTAEQINLDLYRLLAKAGERGPFVLVGHSFGGPIVRSYAERYPRQVAGVALVESSHEAGSYVMNGQAHRYTEGVTARTPPSPSTAAQPAAASQRWGEGDVAQIDPELKSLPVEAQRWHAWAEQQPKFKAAYKSEVEWSPIYLLRLQSSPQNGTLGHRPLIVLTRSESGYEGLDHDLAATLEADRQAEQKSLASLSSRGEQIMHSGGHDMQLTAPDAVAAAIVKVVDEVRADRTGKRR